MHLRARGITAILALGLAFLALPRAASAIPAFARKYHTACTTCHEGFPRLNGVGEAFRLNGYKFNSDDTYIKDEPVKLGSEAYKKVFPESVWPGEIPGMPPIAFQVKQDFEMPVGDAAGPPPPGVKSNFDYPTEVDLVYWGSLGEHMSANVGLDMAGLDPDGSAHLTPHAWLRFESIVGPDHLFNLKAGSMNTRDFGLFTANDENLLGYNSYLELSWALPAATLLPGAVGGPLGFTGNTGAFDTFQPGVELTGFGRPWLYEVGVVNGNGSPLDNNSSKDFFGKVAFKFGGVGFDGSGGAEGATLGGDAGGYWRDDSVTLSAFGYDGSARVTDQSMAKASDYTTDQFWRAGFGALWRWCNLQVEGSVTLGEDEDPYGNLDHATVTSLAWHVGATYFVYPWLVPSVRYEELNVDLPDALVNGSDAAGAIVSEQDRGRIVANVSFLIRANVRAVMEGRAYTFDDRFGGNKPGNFLGEDGDDDQVTLHLLFAF